MNHFRKEDIRSAIAIAVIMVLIGGLTYWAFYLHDDNGLVSLTPTQKREADSLLARIKADSIQRQKAWIQGDDEVQAFPFDPNHADSATLRRVGLTDWQVANMMKYRRKGGRWRSPDDFARLYGLRPEQFQRLRPYIRIAAADRKKEYYEQEFYGTPNAERPSFPKQEKAAEGTTFALNEVDTVELKKIPGIGSYYAGKIVRYREQLGGFVSTAQLNEIEGLPPGISRWFRLEGPQKVHKLNLSRAGFKQLVRHPYLSYEQTCILCNHRRKYGAFRSWSDLHLYKEFKPEDIERMKIYFTLE